jgi:hypothetical protein
MKIIYEKSLWDYREECREDIKKCIEKLEQLGKLDELETQLNYEYSDGISDEGLYDLFLEDFDYLLSLVDMTEDEFFNESEEE